MGRVSGSIRKSFFKREYHFTEYKCKHGEEQPSLAMVSSEESYSCKVLPGLDLFGWGTCWFGTGIRELVICGGADELS